MPDLSTATIVDALARVCAVAIGISQGDLDNHIFAAGVTDAVTTAEPFVVPLADDFSEAGMPAVTVALGPWESILQPGNERLKVTLLGTIWRPRVPLGDNAVLLYGDRDALANALIDHTKAFGHEIHLQSAILQGGPGLQSREIPRAPAGSGSRMFLTLPFTVNVVCNRTVVPQPA